ncbi:hypothetical protein L6452_33074 [Arctium lappa]|uniref:Uncharacterized protein n=1 Tax=Arctium lappa TaxID=4217 RepID=A0ACB8Z635_ARCLA|nr:hypothetical protein L6452_33074 [Arctium lappa]
MQGLVNLRTLEVHHCENLVSLGEKEEDNYGSNLISLRTLKVLFCNNMERCNCPNGIETLIIYNCCSITSVSFPKGGQKLKSLVIWDCDKISEIVLGGVVTENNGLLINSSMSILEAVTLASWKPSFSSIISPMTLCTYNYVADTYGALLPVGTPSEFERILELKPSRWPMWRQMLCLLPWPPQLHMQYFERGCAYQSSGTWQSATTTGFKRFLALTEAAKARKDGPFRELFNA